jgi:predicted Rossmann-fold nucleotide-binding protein
MTQVQPAQPDADIVSLADERAVVDLVTSSVFKLWGAVNDLTRLRPTRRERFRVTIFGSARVPKDHWVYVAVRDLAAECTRMDCDVVTGGGPGLMQAANEGARLADPDGRCKSTGIRVDLPFEQEVNAFVSEAFEHGTFFTRLHHFVLVSDVFVVVPGGIGTVLETMMIWQLLQVRKLHGTPLILAGKMYAELVEWCRKYMLRPDCPLASPQDMTIPVCVEDGPAILSLVRAQHATWQRETGRAS